MENNHQQGKEEYMGVWTKPTPPYIPFPFSLLVYSFSAFLHMVRNFLQFTIA
jgi:hypothetical protein